ncbi:MAG: PD-(D/E)XK nuclease family protein [Planctomycetota bacterium]|nr:PD-(D/E)XK nuclease family protein [Planctomycetota bacterium]
MHPGETRLEFLDWSRPLLPAAAEFIFNTFAGLATPDEPPEPSAGSTGPAPASVGSPPRLLDLSGVLIATPGARAGRMLAALLLEVCQSRGCSLIPPRIVTRGELADQLAPLEAGVRAAGPIAKQIAWERALANLPTDQGALLGSSPALARLLRQSVGDLASHLLTPHDVVARLEAGLPGSDAPESDAERWRAIARASELAESALRAWGLVDADHVRRDRFRVAGGPPSSTHAFKHVLLVGMVELTPLDRAILASLPWPARAIVFAPPELRRELGQAFDAQGCPRRDFWSGVDASLNDDQVVFARDAAMQAAATLSFAQRALQTYDPEEIIIASPDGAVLRALERQSSDRQVPIRVSAGTPLNTSRVVSLLSLVRRLVSPGSSSPESSSTGNRSTGDDSTDPLLNPELSSVAACLLHPDWHAFLARLSMPRAISARVDAQHPRQQANLWSIERSPGSARWIQAFDRWRAELPAARIHADERSWLAHWPGAPAGELDAANEACARTRAALAMLFDEGGVDHAEQVSGDGGVKPARGRIRGAALCARRLRELLQRVYEDVQITPTDGADAVLAAALAAARDSLDELESLEERQTTIASAIGLVIDAVASRAAPPERESRAIDAVGWLELALDPSPVMICAGLNEEAMGSRTPDALLPPALRRALGVPGEPERHARDRYLLRAAIAPREHVLCMAGKIAATQDPLTPSRLLFPALAPPSGSASTEARDAQPTSGLLSRVARWLRESNEDARSSPRAGVNRFTHAPRVPYAPVRSIAVTAFRDYIASPYSFYLKHVLRLHEVEPPDDELNAQQFGTVIHDVLRAWGRSAERHQVSRRAIRDHLFESLRAWSRSQYGSEPPVTVRVQLRAAEARLESFAARQAAWRASGWRVTHTEWQPSSSSHADNASADSSQAHARKPKAPSQKAPSQRTPDGATPSLFSTLDSSASSQDLEPSPSPASRSPAIVLPPAQPGDESIVIGLRGRIDRIDVHDDERMAILDYKTSDKLKDPREAHLKNGGASAPDEPPGWIDLQLPLYRTLAAELGVPSDASKLVLGYVVLPDDPRATAFLDAAFTAEELRRADEAAQQIASAIARGEFDSIGDNPPKFGVLAMLCGHGFIDAPTDAS